MPTAEPPRRGGTMSRAEYFARWAELHGGYDPRTGGRLVRWWLSLTHVVATPLARARVAPDAVTLLGVLVSAGVVGLVWLGGRWVVVAAAVVVLSGLLDNLDGAVAILRSRTSDWGYVLDSVADRLSDGLYLLALHVVGAPGWLCVVGGSLMVLQEYARARAVSGGMAEIGVVTVWERPTRIIVTALFLLGAGLYASAAESWATAGSAAWATLGVVGSVQLLVVVRRRLGGG